MSDDPAGDCGQRTKMTKSPSVLNPVGNGMARRVATARFHSGMLATIGIFATSDLEISILTDVMGLLSSAHSGGEMFEARVMRESRVRISPPVPGFHADDSSCGGRSRQLDPHWGGRQRHHRWGIQPRVATTCRLDPTAVVRRRKGVRGTADVSVGSPSLPTATPAP